MSVPSGLPLPAAKRERLLTVFSALSDPTRIEMFEMIVERGEVGCDEFEIFPLRKSTISYHTKMLSAAGLIETRREGRFFYYRPRLDDLQEELPGLIALLTGSWPRVPGARLNSKRRGRRTVAP